MKATKDKVKGIVLMTPYYMEPCQGDIMRARMDEYGAVVKDTASKYGTYFVDLQAVFDDYLQYRHSSYLTWDRVHPNGTASMLIARAFFRAIGTNIIIE
ncbi:Acetylxylan esterase [bioreactor metagenome]|uniref:Acetylxylan esterase n=1 Tax=bioreactor metagenome TaxID=1076179 RepID=A0A645ILQ2_9ZZZZ